MSAKRGTGAALVAVLALASLWSVRAPRAWADDPHGGYYSRTAAYCESCHQPHLSPSDSHLLVRAAERDVCYTCHNGTGATTDIRSEFGDNGSGSTKTSYHPVPAAVGGYTLTCSDCHTPHWNSAEVIKLLRVRLSGGSYDYSATGMPSPSPSPIGNAFCYACHGRETPYGAASPYPAPLGDHSEFDQSIHNTSAGVPAPASGSGIKCLACHQPHASDFRRLQKGDGEAFCFTCHTQATPRTSGGSNPYYAFTAAANDYSLLDGNGVRIYHHPVSAADQAGGTRVVECDSCHNPHIADQTDGDTTSKIADPTGTDNKWFVTWTPGYAPLTKGDIGAWCTQCHVSPSTTQPIIAGPHVPYTIKMVNDNLPDADGNVHDKFTSAEWAASAKHGPTGSDLACTACHDFHGSSNAYMLRENVVSPDGSRTTTMTGFGALSTDWAKLQSFCLTCHPERGTSHFANVLCTVCHYHTSGRL